MKHDKTNARHQKNTKTVVVQSAPQDLGPNLTEDDGAVITNLREYEDKGESTDDSLGSVTIGGKSLFLRKDNGVLWKMDLKMGLRLSLSPFKKLIRLLLELID